MCSSSHVLATQNVIALASSPSPPPLLGPPGDLVAGAAVVGGVGRNEAAEAATAARQDTICPRVLQRGRCPATCVVAFGRGKRVAGSCTPNGVKVGWNSRPSVARGAVDETAAAQHAIDYRAFVARALAHLVEDERRVGEVIVAEPMQQQK